MGCVQSTAIDSEAKARAYSFSSQPSPLLTLARQ